MVDDISPLRMQKKTRSASICATTGSIETTIHSNLPLADCNAGTPNYRRRRPATRTQSARITTTSTRSVRRRTPNQQQQVLQQNLQETRSYCTSEPRLSETETPPQRRKLSQRKPQQHVTATPRKSNAFLDVPTTNMHHLRVSDDDEDVDRLRTFSSSKGGVINRGDSFRRRRSRSNSLAPLSPLHPQSRAGSFNSNSTSNLLDNNHQATPVDVYRVLMLGAAGVGKQALISQFRTSDCINAYDGPECDEAEQNISIILNGIESELKFSTSTEKDNKDEWDEADAYIVVYSCIDKESFTRAKQIMSRLQDMDLSRTRPIVLVANKIDLARSRAVSAQDGKCLACTFGAKFIEVSVGINHNCDELLAGTLTQIRLKKEHNRLQHNVDNTLGINCKKSKDSSNKSNGQKNNAEHCIEVKSSNNVMGHSETSSSAHWYKSRSVVLASMKARQMLTWILGKEDSKFKHCENFQVL